MRREDEKTRLRRKVRELQVQIEQLQQALPPARLPRHYNRQPNRRAAAELAAEIAKSDT